MKLWDGSTSVLRILWLTAAIFGILLFGYLIQEAYNKPIYDLFDKDAKLLSAFFILLAAAIASASVMRSIASNQKLHDEKLFNEKRTELIYASSTLRNILHSYLIVNNSINDGSAVNYTLEQMSSMKEATIRNMQKLDNKELFSYLEDDDRTQLLILIFNLNSIVHILTYDTLYPAIAFNRIGDKIQGEDGLLENGGRLFDTIDSLI